MADFGSSQAILHAVEEPYCFFPDDIVSNIEMHGYHIVDGCHSEGDVLAFLCRLGKIVQHRDSEATGVTYLATKGAIASLPGFAGFNSEALPPHTDRSALPVPPRLLAMGWCSASSAGGDLRA